MLIWLRLKLGKYKKAGRGRPWERAWATTLVPRSSGIRGGGRGESAPREFRPADAGLAPTGETATAC